MRLPDYCDYCEVNSSSLQAISRTIEKKREFVVAQNPIEKCPINFNWSSTSLRAVSLLSRICSAKIVIYFAIKQNSTFLANAQVPPTSWTPTLILFREKLMGMKIIMKNTAPLVSPFLALCVCPGRAGKKAKCKKTSKK